ncbi:hypothetical protein FM107_08240 [Sphingobacterium sp. JB170]|nr:hypothetical protein FM107_08240 [Sphingobacterium sp. JB170]
MPAISFARVSVNPSRCKLLIVETTFNTESVCAHVALLIFHWWQTIYG